MKNLRRGGGGNAEGGRLMGRERKGKRYGRRELLEV